MWCLTKTVAAIVGVACGLVACRGGESLSESPEAEDFESASLYDPAHVASLPDAAFVVEADIAAMTELGSRWSVEGSEGPKADQPSADFGHVDEVL
jgi:hypothetical protein